MTSSQDKTRHRPVRSYVLRATRFTQAQRRSLDEHWQTYVIDHQALQEDVRTCFDVEQPLTIEIGFGMGDSLLQMAREQPHINFLGIEVHRPGIGRLLQGLASEGISNVRVMVHDANEIIARTIRGDSVNRFLILFPDPWHKQRHHKRRLIKPAFAELIVDRLQQGGTLHLATDWQPYAEWMLQVLEACEGLVNVNGRNEFWRSPMRPETKFQRRGQRLGHGVWDLLYRRED